MKGYHIIPLLSLILAVPLNAQTTEVEALDRAKETIATADATYHAQEAEVLQPAAPQLPEEPVFEVPSGEVYLDLPGAKVEGSAVSGDAEKISVDFPEEDVRDIIRSVAELYELNVVIPDSLAGSVSIKLRDVTWQQVFDVVLEPLKFTYIIDGNIIKIKSQDELAVEPVDTRVFIIDFAKAAEIRGSVEPLIDGEAGGKIQVDTRSNALVITERPSRMNDIQEIIETLDRPTEQVMIESKFIEVTARDSSKLGINWQSLDGWGFGVEGTTASGEGGPEASAGRIIMPMNQITDDWSRAVLATDAFRAVLSALDALTDTELVSNPTVVTMNNFPAQINIGEEYPIPNYTYNDERGSFEVSGFTYKNIGINLNVTPQINSAGFINLSIQPEISNRTGVAIFNDAEIPIISTRKTVSTVTVKSGYTLAIGGLIQKTTENGETRVPVVGSIPVLGRLFSHKSDSVDKRNLIVFITAKILSASGATYEDIFTPKTLHEMGVSSRDVPGHEVEEAEMDLYKQALESRDNVDKVSSELKVREEMYKLEETQTDTEADLNQQIEDPGQEKERVRRNYQQ